MTRRTFTWNAYETTLTQPLLNGITTAIVESTAGLASPVYLVIDPDVPGKREWVRVNTINGNFNLENLVRNQTGSVGDIDHDFGAKVRAIFAQQHLDDIFQDIQENTAALTGVGGHVPDTGDPHVAAGYLKQGTANNTYLALDGSKPMAGVLDMATNAITGLPLAPVNPSDAVSKDYIDNLPAGFSGLHADLTDLPLPDAHHTRYANTEAIDAMGPVGDANPYNHTKYSAGVEGPTNPENHARYANSEAVDAMGVLGDGNPLNHARFDDVPNDGQIYGRRDGSWDAAGADYYNKSEIDTILQQYYTLNTAARAFAGSRIYLQSGDPGAISNGDIWHDLP